MSFFPHPLESHSHEHHDKCFVCYEPIDWIKDYGHAFLDGLASCVFCYNTKEVTLIWREQYDKKVQQLQTESRK
jgi:hypothetical protein